MIIQAVPTESCIFGNDYPVAAWIIVYSKNMLIDSVVLEHLSQWRYYIILPPRGIAQGIAHPKYFSMKRNNSTSNKE